MGSAIGTSGLVGFSMVLLIIMAILIIIATDRVKNITGYSKSDDLKSSTDKLVWAQVLAWIAAGLALLLVLGYVTLHFININEWVHLILWILIFTAIIISIVIIAMALSDIDNSNINDDNSSTGYLWGALILGAVAFMVLLISGGWRIASKQYENEPEQQMYMAAGTTTSGAPYGQAEQPPQTQLQVNTYPPNGNTSATYPPTYGNTSATYPPTYGSGNI